MQEKNEKNELTPLPLSKNIERGDTLWIIKPDRKRYKIHSA
jgi:hypothetical protein